MILKLLSCLLVSLLCFWPEVNGAEKMAEIVRTEFPVIKKDSLAAVGTINRNYKLHARKAVGAIKLDGNFDEEDWI